MEYLSFQNLSFSELEADIVEKWSFQYQDYYSFDSFIQYLKDMNKWVEFLFEQSKKFEVTPRAKFASVYYLFRYFKELERDLSKQKSMSEKMMDLHLVCCACLMLSCKRFCGFTLSVDSLVENMGNRFSPKDFYACEIEIFQTLRYNLNVVVFTDFVELYLACFWTIVPRVLEVNVQELLNKCIALTDLIHNDPQLFLTSGSIKLLACVVIASSSRLITGKPERSESLLLWCAYDVDCFITRTNTNTSCMAVSNISKEKDKIIKEGANKLLNNLLDDVTSK